MYSFNYLECLFKVVQVQVRKEEVVLHEMHRDNYITLVYFGCLLLLKNAFKITCGSFCSFCATAELCLIFVNIFSEFFHCTCTSVIYQGSSLFLYCDVQL